LLAFTENLSIPQPLAAVRDRPRNEWTTWLRLQPGALIIAHIPFPGGGHVSDYERETWRMYAQLDHHRPIINGYSGFFPPGYLDFQARMAHEFPSQNTLCLLAQRLGATTVVIDAAWQATHETQLAAVREALIDRFHDASLSIYQLALPQTWCSNVAQN
jgi:hypothetical protein